MKYDDLVKLAESDFLYSSMAKGNCVDLVVPEYSGKETLEMISNSLNQVPKFTNSHHAVFVWGHFPRWQYRIPFWRQSVSSFLKKCKNPIAKEAAEDILSSNLAYNIINTGFNTKLLAKLAVAIEQDRAVVFSSLGCDPVGVKQISKFCCSISEIALPIHISNGESWLSAYEGWTTLSLAKTID